MVESDSYADRVSKIFERINNIQVSFEVISEFS